MKKILLCLLILTLAIPADAWVRKSVYIEREPIRGFECKAHGREEYALVIITDKEEYFCIEKVLEFLRKKAKVERKK